MAEVFQPALTSFIRYKTVNPARKGPHRGSLEKFGKIRR